MALVLSCPATFRNTRSKLGLGRSAPTSRAISMKRFDCAGSSCGGFGFRGISVRRSKQGKGAVIRISGGPVRKYDIAAAKPARRYPHDSASFAVATCEGRNPPSLGKQTHVIWRDADTVYRRESVRAAICCIRPLETLHRHRQIAAVEIIALADLCIRRSKRCRKENGDA